MLCEAALDISVKGTTILLCMFVMRVTCHKNVSFKIFSLSYQKKDCRVGPGTYDTDFTI